MTNVSQNESIQKEPKNRETGIDTLRTVAALMVVGLHCTASSFAAHTERLDGGFWVANGAEGLLRVCVPLFVLISGRYLLKKRVPLPTFYGGKVLKLVLLTALWGTLYTIAKTGAFVLQGSPADIPTRMAEFAAGQPYYHLWYLFMLLGLYGVTPLLWRLLEVIPERFHAVLAAGLMIMGMGLEYRDMVLQYQPHWLLWWVKYVGYYMMGWVLRKPLKVSSGVLLGLYALSAAATAMVSYFTIKYMNYNIYFYSYASPFVAIGAVALYGFFSRNGFSENRFSRYAASSFGLYLIHPVVLTVVEVLWGADRIGPAGDISVRFVAVMAVAVPLTWVARRMPVIRNMV